MYTLTETDIKELVRAVVGERMLSKAVDSRANTGRNKNDLSAELI